MNKNYWNTLGEWNSIGVEDLKKQNEKDYIPKTCQLCNQSQIRFVHSMEHKDTKEILEVGCVCATYLEVGKDSPFENEVKKQYKKKERKLVIENQKKEIEAKHLENENKEKEEFTNYIKNVLKHPFIVGHREWIKETQYRLYLKTNQYNNKLKIYIDLRKRDKNIYISTVTNYDNIYFMRKNSEMFNSFYEDNISYIIER